eukprot:GHVU01035301.1.p1 GENE.GHVU01035301.1~~GHVU01035301.1.p1  ORF type:complete len:185 (-),score=10.98 GHVU01035301.1:748-1302(-)
MKAGDALTSLHNDWYFAAIVPALIWGLITDFAGIAVTMMLMTLIGIATFLLPLFGGVPLQMTNVFLFIIVNCNTMGSMQCYLANVFGYSLLGVLLGVCSLCAATVGFMTPFWNRYIYDTCQGSFSSAHKIVAAASLLALVLPIYNICFPPRPPKELTAAERASLVVSEVRASCMSRQASISGHF